MRSAVAEMDLDKIVQGVVEGMDFMAARDLDKIVHRVVAKIGHAGNEISINKGASDTAYKQCESTDAAVQGIGAEVSQKSD